MNILYLNTQIIAEYSFKRMRSLHEIMSITASVAAIRMVPVAAIRMG
ncbi:MAG: hypothetical protein KME22_25075 [Hassallia sp. WJT32-NPBG1]|nr:hypothetical protein [Hassallia sp. WJT32-NPBG1]